jgi:hypothetical protein
VCPLAPCNPAANSLGWIVPAVGGIGAGVTQIRIIADLGVPGARPARLFTITIPGGTSPTHTDLITGVHDDWNLNGVVLALSDTPHFQIAGHPRLRAQVDRRVPVPARLLID